MGSFTKCPEICKYKKINVHGYSEILHEMIARYDISDDIVSNDAAQITSYEFKEFCKLFSIKHIAIPMYHQCQTDKLNGLGVILNDLWIKQVMKYCAKVH